MSSPIDSAAKGLAQSQAQLASSAKRLVQSASQSKTFSSEIAPKTPAASAFAKVDQPQGETRRSSSTASSAPSSRFSDTPLQGQGAYIPSMAEETVQMRMAANAYKANARMMQAADDILKMTQEALAVDKDAASNEDS